MKNLKKQISPQDLPRFDHVELVTPQINTLSSYFQKMGFTKDETPKGHLLHQGEIRIFLTNPIEDTMSLNRDFLEKHGGGISLVGFEVNNCMESFESATRNGARVATAPQVVNSHGSRATICELWSPSDLRFRLISREIQPLSSQETSDLDWIVNPPQDIKNSDDLFEIDHIANVVLQGEMEPWLQFYENVFGFKRGDVFNVKSKESGLKVGVSRSQNNRAKITVVEPLGAQGQIQTFINQFGGEGIQHLAFRSSNIQKTLSRIKRQGISMLNQPAGYYEQLRKRYPQDTALISELKNFSILMNKKPDGTLLQVFSEPIIGPFFLEVIERESQNGFGEGNIRALLETVDQESSRKSAYSTQKVA